MNASSIYVILSIAVLAVICAALLFVGKKKGKRLSTLAGIAFAFIIAGIFFADNRIIGYGLIGAGVAIAVLDILIKSRKR